MPENLLRTYCSAFIISLMSFSSQASTLLNLDCKKDLSVIHVTHVEEQQPTHHHDDEGHEQLTKKHEHRHRHAPGEPEHTHEHEHSTATICASLVLSIPPVLTTTSLAPEMTQYSFSMAQQNLHPDPTLSSIFRPPIL